MSSPAQWKVRHVVLFSLVSSLCVLTHWRFSIPIKLFLLEDTLFLFFLIHEVFSGFTSLFIISSTISERYLQTKAKILEVAIGRSSSQQIHLTKPCYLCKFSLYFRNVSFLWFFSLQACFLQVIQLSCSWFPNSVMKISTGY